jgi:predicted cupin superfamily sugar epimerase
MINAEQVKSLLRLEPHPSEGGYFREIYRSKDNFPADALPERYRGTRSFSTAIYYLLTPDTFSAMHRLKSDEIFHFYMGDPVEMLQLHPDGTGITITIGTDIRAGMQPQVLVPMNIWQGARLKPGGNFALLGTTVSPGFDSNDYEDGGRGYLITLYPRFRSLIINLTRE